MRIAKMAAEGRLYVFILAALCTTLFLGTTFAAPPAQARSITYDLDIPAQNLNDALQAFAIASQHKLLYSSELVDGKRSPALKGQFTTEQAVKALLTGTQLSYEVTSDGLVLIRAEGEPPPTTTPPPPTGDDSAKEGKKSSSSGFRVAQVDQGKNSSDVSVVDQTTASNQGTGLTEIIVTAQKRNERLQDVPVPVTAISADTLVSSNLVRLQDYFTSVPGLSVTPDDARGAPILTIRGLTTGGYSNPTVGITIDDIPYGASTNLGGGFAAPDVDPSDLQRIEVLRGPQGTLYGASSIGGLLKYVTLDPSTESLSGHVQVGTETIYNASDLGYNVRGAVNVPISDVVAIRASGFVRQDPGYIDNIFTGRDGINKLDSEGGHLAALWRPSEDLSVKVSALYQDNKSYGSPDVEVGPGLGDLQQNDIYNTGGYDRNVQAYSAIVKVKLGIAEITSLTGYSINTVHDSFDTTYVFGPYTAAQFDGVTGTPLTDHNRTSKLSQELRLSMPLGSRVDWLFGGFFTREDTQYFQQLFGTNPTTGQVVGQWVTWNFPSNYSEYAAFTDFTVHFTDDFNVQFGGRESHNRQVYSEVDTGPYVPIFELGFTSPLIFPRVVTNLNSFTYLVTPQFKVSPDFMVYARLASGYRPGGPNQEATPFGLPATYKPDTTKNYELGAKGDILNHTLSFDGSIYYIDWKNIQLSLTDPTNLLTYYANATQAKSQGVELSVESKPLAGLTIAGWVAFSDAKLTAGFPTISELAGGAYGVSGDRLPDSSRFSSNLSVNDEFSLTRNVTGFAGAAVSYVGERLGAFTPTPQRQNLPAYAKTDVLAGVKYESWTVNLYVNNLADRRGVLTGGLGTFPNPTAFNYIQPRTIGVSVAKSF